jgi:flagellar biosynthesis chaperone FliJ
MSRLLDILARLRRFEAEQAKRDLAGAIAAETAAKRAMTQAQALVAREARVANPAAPGAFAAWLPAASARIAACKAAETEAATARDAARAALAGRRAALKATDTLVEARAQQAKLEAERRAARSMDDVARPERDGFG